MEPLSISNSWSCFRGEDEPPIEGVGSDQPAFGYQLLTASAYRVSKVYP